MNKNRTENKLSKWYENFFYVFRASMARRRFWMINSLLPKSPDGKTLKEAVDIAQNNNQKILDLGCGDRAQALVDLRNQGYDNLYGIDLKPPENIYEKIQIEKGTLVKMKYPDNFFDGVVFSSYVFPHLKPMEQYNALEEIDRITSSGSRGYIGPFSIYHYKNTDFSKKFPDHKNPLFGYIKKKNSAKKGKWQLWKSYLMNLAIYKKSNNMVEKGYRMNIPFYMAYFLSSRGLLNTVIPTRKVNKDSLGKMPFEYFITFQK